MVLVFVVILFVDIKFGGKYLVFFNDIIMILMFMLYCDVSVWGDDVEVFCFE